LTKIWNSSKFAGTETFKIVFKTTGSNDLSHIVQMMYVKSSTKIYYFILP